MKRRQDDRPRFIEMLVFGLAGVMMLFIAFHLIKKVLARAELLSAPPAAEHGGFEKHELGGSPPEQAVSQLPAIRVSSPGVSRRRPIKIPPP